MSTTLREFLKEKSAVYAAEAEKNKQITEEWQAAIDKLFQQLNDWLAAVDPERIIQRKVGSMEVTEPGLGRYQVSHLTLRAFGKSVYLIPKARMTIKAATPPQKNSPERSTGRVDLTDEIRRYVLYRFPTESGDEWFIHDTAMQSDLQPLTSERFEAALLSYFQ